MRFLISIVTYNSSATIVKCLDRIKHAQANIDGLIRVFDNHSQDDTTAKIKTSFQDVDVISSEKNHGYAYGVNRCAEIDRWDFMLILNPDVYLSDDSIVTGIEYLKRNTDVGLLGAKIVNSSGESIHSHGDLPTPETFVSDFSILKKVFQKNISKSYLSVIDEQSPFDAGFVTGAFMLIPNAAWKDNGPMDESLFLYYEDVDWAFRLKQKNMRIMVHPGIVVEHESGASFDKSPESDKFKMKFWFQSAYRYFAKHYGEEAGKSAFSRMLKLAKSKLAVLKIAGKIRSDSADRQRMIIEIHQEIAGNNTLTL